MVADPNILFVADVPLADPCSGSEQVLYNQAVGLAHSGMKVYAITRRNGSNPTIYRRVNGCIDEACYSVSTGNIVKFFHSLFKETSRQFSLFSEGRAFDVAVCHHPFAYFSLLMSGKLKNIPVIHVFHSPTHQEYMLLNEDRNWLQNLFPVKARWMIEKYCHHKSSQIMVLSQYMKEKIINTYRISGENIIVNPGGVDLKKFTPDTSRMVLKRKLGFPEDKIHLLTVRNLEPRMGLDSLIKCLGILKAQKENVQLYIGGEGDEKNSLEKLIADYDLSDTITMLGYIPAELLPQYYRAADFFVLPTRRLEGFGLVTVEALACGTPVLGTPVGGTTEILAGLNGDLIFNDATAEAMAEGIQQAAKSYFADETRYIDLRLQCHKYAKANYSWDRHVRQLQSAIMEIKGDYKTEVNDRIVSYG